MVIAKESPFPEPIKQKEPGKHPVRNAVLGGTAALGITAGSIIAGLEAVGVGPITGGGTPDTSHTENLPGGMPSATAIATNVVEISPTPKVEPTVKPTPVPTPEPTPQATEAPKFTYWTQEQINQALQEAASRGESVFVDTWSRKGGKEDETTVLTTGASVFVINGIPAGETFDSPFTGMVERVDLGLFPAGYRARVIRIKVSDKLSVTFLMPEDSEPLVRPGEIINMGSPLGRLTGSMTPGTRDQGEVSFVGYNPSNNSLYKPNILTDENGQRVLLPEDK